MNHIVRSSTLCTTDWCDAKKEIEALRKQVAELTQERDELLVDPHSKCCEWRVATVEAELCALLEKAEDQLDRIVKFDAMTYDMEASGMKRIAREALAAIKQWKEGT